MMFLSFGKGMANYEKNMLEFVSPAELGATPVNKQNNNPQEKPCKKHNKNCDVLSKPLELKALDTITEPKALKKAKHQTHQQGLAIPHMTPPPSPLPTTDKIMASYRLGSGDKIKITVFDEKELSGTYLVNEEGFISFPLIGSVHVLDKTIQDVKIIMNEKLSDGYLIDPSIAIEVEEFRPIYVMGEVRNPGKFAFMTDMTVRNAVAIAGGFTYRAKQDSVRILRGMNKNSIHEIEGVKPDSKIKPGDTILIKERFF